MLKRGELEDIISEYRQSHIQSEAEVRTKLIVPLIRWLGYPQSLRAEEFPVYGFEGGKALPAKDADFILFTDALFGEHRSSNEEDITWVQDHSLIVIEAKKPGKMPSVLGQPQFYSIWTRSVAYLATDGETIRGRMVKMLSADTTVIDCKIDDLPENEALLCFSYENIRKAKEDGLISLRHFQEGLCLSTIDGEFVRYVSPEEEVQIPEEAISYIQKSLGKNAEGLSRYELVYKFLRMTDSYLENDIRYGIPDYMIDMPRRRLKASICIDNHLFTLIQGQVDVFYCNEIERFQFSGDDVILNLALSDGELVYIGFGYEVLELYADQRLSKFQAIKQLVCAHAIKLVVQDRVIEVTNRGLEAFHQQISTIEYWMDEMRKIQEIEKFFGIRIRLNEIKTLEASEETYRAIDVVFSGIHMKTNICSRVDRTKLDSRVEEIEDPLLIASGDKIGLPCISIHEHIFSPHRLYLMPFQNTQIDENSVIIEYSVQYKVL